VAVVAAAGVVLTATDRKVETVAGRSMLKRLAAMAMATR